MSRKSLESKMVPNKNPHMSSNQKNSLANTASNSESNNAGTHQNLSGARFVSVPSHAQTTQRRRTGTVPKITMPVTRLEHDSSQDAKMLNMVVVNANESRLVKSTAKRFATYHMIQQQQKQSKHFQKQQQLPLPAVNERGHPISTTTVSTQPQQQMQQQQHILQRKNTEIVAPLPRELKDLNAYILSAVATTTNNNTNIQQTQQRRHQSKHYNLTKLQQQQFSQQQGNENNSLNSATEIDTILDNQPRFCYPVKPLPRRNLHNNDTATHEFGDNSNSYNVTTGTPASNLNLLNHPAAIGVVIPTTPGIPNNSGSNNNSSAGAEGGLGGTINNNCHFLAPNSKEEPDIVHDIAALITRANTRADNSANNNSNNIDTKDRNITINQQQLLMLQQLQQQIEEQSSHLLAAVIPQQQQQSVKPATNLNFADLDSSSIHQSSANSSIETEAATDISFLQRLQLIQQILAPNTKPSQGAVPSCPQADKNNRLNMVNDVRSPTATERDVIVNSTSLEDVAQSEISDNRAQSIQSLHSAFGETPTADPSFEELQQRLEISNRNIQNMQEQQKQLLHMQQQAKSHLSEMETIRQGAALRCGQQNGDASNNPPNYQSLQEVQSDMSSLLGRMKNLTTFIQHQNELGNLLGDDGPDILAEQETLQRKLQSLRMQRDDMRNLVGELQEIQRGAELTVDKRKQDYEDQRPQSQLEQSLRPEDVPRSVDTDVVRGSPLSNERIVPIEYTRIVPTELEPAKGAVVAQIPLSADDAVDPETAEMIRKKVSDIAAMKAQLNRLKNMMDTVNLIEAHTARGDVKEVGRVARETGVIDIPVQRERSTPSYELPASHDRERTPTAADLENDPENKLISAKVRMLNEVTSDLRAQALVLQAERDRITALKDEIVRRKAEAAAAAQMGEDALKSHSLTPTPQMQRRDTEVEAERHFLKEEYESKKKDFDELCRRLKQDEDYEAPPTPSKTLPKNQVNGIRDIVSEADDEAEPEEEPTESDFAATASVEDSRNKYYVAPVANINESSANREAKHTSVINGSFKHVVGKRPIDDPAAVTRVAKSTHEAVGSMEAASIKSGSSQSFSLPPSMNPINTTLSSSWRQAPVPPPLPSTWNPHFYYGCSSAQQPATSYTPPHCIGSMHQQQCHGTGVHIDCICNASQSASALDAAVNTTNSGDTSAATIGSVSLNTDSMVFQQFVQTQQMLINSVCQCNQMLWHQQREIDVLNNAIHVIQNRLLTLSGRSTADPGFNVRADSVPPQTVYNAGLQQGNNLYTAMQNRAQSEQPSAYQPLTCRSAFASYQQQPHLHHQHHHVFQQQRTALGYDYGAEMQQLQQQNANTNANIYTALNNAATVSAPPPPPPPPQFNNEAPPQSPSIATAAAAGPGPIFMHHHNNSIHQNNANLRTQNHHANNLQQHSNIAAVNASNTLNNQVPPGNRANNYWDNFRSYSRQNLLSTNSNKSNEDQNQQQTHQQQQLDDQYHQSSSSGPLLPQSGLQQQHVPPQSQSLYHQQQHQGHITQNNHCNTTDCNRVSYESNNSSSNNNNATCNKYMRFLQRSHINQLQQQQQGVGSMLSSTSAASNTFQSGAPSAPPRELLENLNWQANVVDGSVVVDDNDLYERYNISSNNDMSASYAGAAAGNIRNVNNMNMNVNCGNSMQYRRNKVPSKSTCRSATPLQGANLQQLMTSAQQQQHQYLDQRYGLASSSTGSAPPPQSTSAAPPAQSLSTSSAATLTSRNPEDYLLCTVDMASGYNYAAPADHNFEVDCITAPTAKEDDDDTTSEEIKRNLLVNALKNDKFTTKFYESIKEDVFRRLESILLEKESTQRPGGAAEKPLQPQQQQPRYATHLVNDVGGEGDSPRNPTRKLYLNAQMGSRRQPQHMSSTAEIFHEMNDEPSFVAELARYERNIADETESNNADDNELSEISELISANANESACNLVATCSLEDEEPEENETQNHIRNINSSASYLPPQTTQSSATSSNLTSTASYLPSSIMQSGATESTFNPGIMRDKALELPSGNRLVMSGKELPPTGKEMDNDACQKKRKNQRQQGQIPPNEAVPSEGAIAEQTAPTTTVKDQDSSNTSSKCVDDTTTNLPNFDLVNYIINRIHNQTHPSTLINDTLLVEIAKLTATAAQNSNATKLAYAAKSGGGDSSLVSMQQQHQHHVPNMSPKKIYSKIRKLSNVPRQRDQFLSWYHSYLETLFFVQNKNVKCSVSDKKSQHNQHNAAIRNMQPSSVDTSNNKSEMKIQNGTENIAPTNNSISSSGNSSDNNNNHGSQVFNLSPNANNLAMNDADLAEADQTCSANTSTNHDDEVDADVNPVNRIAISNEQHANLDANHTIQIKEENNFDELENNENPEEEGAAAASSHIDIIKADGIKQELNITDIKIEANITEMQQRNDLNRAAAPQQHVPDFNIDNLNGNSDATTAATTTTATEKDLMKRIKRNSVA